MPRVLSYVLTAGLTACCALSAQTTITGRLQQKRGDALTPVRDCTVYARSLDAGPLVGEYPDDQGRFILQFPPQDRVTVGTICRGYRVAAVNGRPVPRLTFDCSRPGHCADVELTLEPRAVVEGFVVDQTGTPVERVDVQLRHVIAGRRPRRHNTVSDDRGYFRFFHLPAGKYELSPVGRRSHQGLTWKGDSQTIVLGAGDVESGVRVEVRFVEPLELTGRIEGLPPGTTSIQMVLKGMSESGRLTSTFGVTVDEEGRFRVSRVQRGKYHVLVMLPNEEGEYNRSERWHVGTVDLRRDSGEFELARHRPTRLRGAVEVEWPHNGNLSQPANQRQVTLHLVAADEHTELVHAKAPAYEFDVKTVRPGRYRLGFIGARDRGERRTPQGEWGPIGEVVVSEGRTTRLDLRVRFEVGRLTVLVRPAAGSQDAQPGEPMGHYFVGFRRNGEPMLAPTDQNGRLVLEFFEGGDYEICAWRRITWEKVANPGTWREAGDAVRRFRHEDGVDMEITLTAAP